MDQDCVNEFIPNCERCVGPFHVVEWAMEALDEVRCEVWWEAYTEAIKNSAFAQGKVPEHLTGNQRIAIIAENNNRLYRAYRIKETLRLLRCISSNRRSKTTSLQTLKHAGQVAAAPFPASGEDGSGWSQGAGSRDESLAGS